MENVLQNIITSEVNKNFVTEKAFYENFLNITQQSWNRWKRGERGFSNENMNYLKTLYSDYEWMIVLKVVDILEADDFDAEDFGYEIETEDEDDYPYQLYLQIKQDIAKEWIKNGADIDIIGEEYEETDESRKNPGSKVTIGMDYDLPIDQDKDELSFHLTKIKGKVKDKKKKRKKWFSKNQKHIV